MESTHLNTPKRAGNLVDVEVASKYRNPLIRWRKKRAGEPSASPNSAVIIEVGSAECDTSDSTGTPDNMSEPEMLDNITLYLMFFNPKVSIDPGSAKGKWCTSVAKASLVKLIITE